MFKETILIGIVVLLLVVPVAAQEDNTREFAVTVFDIAIDIPADWSAAANPQGFFIAENAADLTVDQNLSGAVISLQSIAISELPANGYVGDIDLEPIFVAATDVVSFDGAAPTATAWFGLPALQARGVVAGQPSVLSLALDDSHIYLLQMFAPTEDRLDMLLDEWDAMLASARPIDVAALIPPGYEQAPAGVDLFADYDGFQAYIAQIDGTDPAADQAAADALYGQLRATDNIPLVFGTQAIFVYQGSGQSVEVRGQFTAWSTSPRGDMTRLGASDLWMTEFSLPIDARAEYKIVKDGSTWILDPANPHRQTGGLGDNSVVNMPDFSTTSFTTARDDIAIGTLSDDILISSDALGYDLEYRVYTPANYDTLDDLPVVFVTDGNDFRHPRMGAMHVVADNLIAEGLVQPMVIVFIDARSPIARTNRRENEFLQNPDYAAFVVEELIPTIAADYKVSDARMLVGTSYGGVAALYISIEYPTAFSMVTVFSPATWAAPGLLERYQTSAPLPYRVWISSGIRQWDIGDIDAIIASVSASTDAQLTLVPEGHSWGHWSDMTDEMLIYFLGTD